MRQVNIHEAKSQLSRLLAEVEAGEEIIIARSGKPVARLISAKSSTQPRKPGALKGQIWMSEDFDAPLPDDLLEAFEGKDA
jgi:prevent-host-death family protein